MDKTIEQEVESFKQDRNEKSALAIVNHVMPILNHVVSGFTIWGHEKDDLKQIALLGLLLSLKNYKPYPNAGFGAFARVVFKARLCDLYERETELKRKNTFKRIDCDRLLTLNSPLLNCIVAEEVDRFRSRLSPDLSTKQRYNIYYGCKKQFLVARKKTILRPIKSSLGARFASVSFAASKLGISKKRLLAAIKDQTICAGTYWQWNNNE